MTNTEKGLRLSDIAVGETVRLERIEGFGKLRRRLMELGFLNGATVFCVGESPFGDPRAYLTCSAVTVIRNKDSERITCRKI